MQGDLNEVFNRLSMPEKIALKSSAFITKMSNNMRTETDKAPWKYPFYATYLATIATPLPFFGAGTVVIAATAGIIYAGLTPGSRRLRGELKEIFNNESLVKAHENCFVEKKDQNDKTFYKLNNKKLAASTTKKVWKDSTVATKRAVGAAINLFTFK
jgi:hypothetical protein